MISDDITMLEVLGRELPVMGIPIQRFPLSERRESFYNDDAVLLVRSQDIDLLNETDVVCRMIVIATIKPVTEALYLSIVEGSNVPIIVASSESALAKGVAIVTLLRNVQSNVNPTDYAIVLSDRDTWMARRAKTIITTTSLRFPSNVTVLRIELD